MKCNHCTEEIQQGDQYCSNCGKPVMQDSQQPKKIENKKKSYIAQIAIGLGVVVIIAGIGMVTINAQREKQARENARIEKRESEERAENKRLKELKAAKEASKTEAPVAPWLEAPEAPREKAPEYEPASEPVRESADQWIYYKVEGEDTGIYKSHKTGDYEIKILDGEEVGSWAVMDEMVVYAPAMYDPTPYYDMALGGYNLPNDSFGNAIYTVYEEDSSPQSLVIGDIYNVNDPREKDLMHLYEILFAHEGWIYFQIQTVIMESGGWYEGHHLSKIRLDGSGLTMLSTDGVSGELAAIQGSKAYFNSESYGGDMSDVRVLDLQTGVVSDLIYDAAIVGIQGDTIYYHREYETTVHSMNINSLEEIDELYVNLYQDTYCYLDGDIICEDNYGGGYVEIGQLNFTNQELKNMNYSKYGYAGVTEDGYRYYAENMGDWCDLYKKDLITGEVTLLTSNNGYIYEIKTYN